MDSLGHNRQQINISKKIGQKIFSDIAEWEYITTPPQTELECGAQTFLIIREIADTFSFEHNDFDEYKVKFNSITCQRNMIATLSRQLIHSHITSTTAIYSSNIFFSANNSFPHLEHKYHLDHMETETSHKEIQIKEEIQKVVKEERINDCEILDETLSRLNIPQQ